MPKPDDRLSQELAKSPYLIINCAAATARLAAEAEMLAALGHADYFIMDLRRALKNFAKLEDGCDQYTLADMAKVAGISYFVAHAWMRAEIIRPSIRPVGTGTRWDGPLFSFTDAFVAGVVGALRRQGQNLEILKSVAPLFTEKRTARGLQPARRS